MCGFCVYVYVYVCMFVCIYAHEDQEKEQKSQTFAGWMACFMGAGIWTPVLMAAQQVPLTKTPQTSKQRKFISHGAGGQEVQVHSPGRFTYDSRSLLPDLWQPSPWCFFMWTEPEVSLCFFNPLPLTEPVTGHLGDMNEFGGCADIQVLKPLEKSISCSPKSVTILGNGKQN